MTKPQHGGLISYRARGLTPRDLTAIPLDISAATKFFRYPDRTYMSSFRLHDHFRKVLAFVADALILPAPGLCRNRSWQRQQRPKQRQQHGRDKIAVVESCDHCCTNLSSLMARYSGTDLGTLKVKSYPVRRLDTSRFCAVPVSGSITGSPVFLSMTSSSRSDSFVRLVRSQRPIGP
jgi:hypothetical protein